ncbi:MAG: sodium:solute symporter family protein [Deltaproteobacteria bacterium]|nr:MAG: sodium:solute symporter family protein [Deltaproteobacteria bacterium]
MAIKITILGGYLLLVLLIGIVARTRWKSSPETYFLADRRLGPLVLLGTMAATNFSAFTVFGTSGAGYRDGYAFFPIMGFGTGFMAVTFWVLGRRIWEVGRERSIVTPPELVRSLYDSRLLGALFAAVMVIFTIPYLALQPMAAGYALEALVGLPYFYGCTLVTGVIVLYTLRGGMRAVAWTDLFQGVVMMVMLLVSLAVVVNHHGGLAAAHQKVMAVHPELFSRPGGRGYYTPAIWFSYMLLWFFCDPMFPQLFQRFFAAKRRRTLSQIMIGYPLVCTLVFFLPIAIGVLGRLTFPGLTGKEADKILPLVVTAISGEAMAALVMASGLAALMSTMDSQLLTLSSIFTRDLLPLATGRKTAGTAAGRIFVVFLSLCGLALAYEPPDTILQIATQTFTGLAVLFPAVVFGLYLKRRHPLPAILSILVGEALLVVFYLRWLPTGPFLPVVWVLLAGFGVYLASHWLLVRPTSLAPAWLRDPYFWMLTALFILAMDFWAWERIGPLAGGLPAWIGYFVLLSIGQTALTYRWVRAHRSR